MLGIKEIHQHQISMNYSNKDLPKGCNNRIAPFLEGEEKLLWCGQPAMKLFHWTDFFLVPFSLLLAWTTYVIASLLLSIGNFLGWTLLLVCFLVLMTAHLTVGRFIHYYWQRKCTFYALSDKRVIILSSFLRQTLKSTMLKDIGEIRRLTNNSTNGSIILGRCTNHQLAALERLGWRCLYTPFVSTNSLMVFFDIDDVRDVYLKVDDARAQAKQEESIVTRNSTLIANASTDSVSNLIATESTFDWGSKSGESKASFLINERIKKAFGDCLEQDEKILWGGQPIFKFELLVAMVLFVTGVVAGVHGAIWLLTSDIYLLFFASQVAIFSLLCVVSYPYSIQNTYYAVTNKRVIALFPRLVANSLFARDLNKIHVVNTNKRPFCTEEISFRPPAENWWLRLQNGNSVIADREPVFYNIENATDVVNLVNTLRAEVQSAIPKQPRRDDASLLLQYPTPRRLPISLILQELFCGHNAALAWLPLLIALIIGFPLLGIQSITTDWSGIFVSLGAGAETDASVIGSLQNGMLWKAEYLYKVRFKTKDGRNSIAQIYTDQKLQKGAKVKIKYLPKVPNEAFPADLNKISCYICNQIVILQMALAVLLIILVPGMVFLAMHLIGSLKALSMVRESRVALGTSADNERLVLPGVVQREYEYSVGNHIYKTFSYAGPSQLPDKKSLVLYDAEVPSKSIVLSDMAGQPELLPGGSIELRQPIGWRIAFLLVPAIIGGVICKLGFWLFSYLP